jgi:hypothetical protein
MLIDAMETAAFFCHIHTHARVKAIEKLLTNTAHFFERPAPKESFGLHNETTIHPVGFYLEEIIERPKRRRGDGHPVCPQPMSPMKMFPAAFLVSS